MIPHKIRVMAEKVSIVDITGLNESFQSYFTRVETALSTIITRDGMRPPPNANIMKAK